MRVACNTLLKWGKEKAGVKNVVIRIWEENKGSRNVVEWLIEKGWGFARCEGEDEWEEGGLGGEKVVIWFGDVGCEEREEW